MADIDVVKARNGSKVWLWVLLVIVALLVIWFMTAETPKRLRGRDWMEGSHTRLPPIGLAWARTAKAAKVQQNGRRQTWSTAGSSLRCSSAGH